jgi:adenylate kinase family enzyme
LKKIAVFGKPANGKSTLSRRLAMATRIKLFSIDSILFRANGEEIDRQEYETKHSHIVSTEEWIIEGFGPLNSLSSFYQRIEAADTLVYIDLPYSLTYWLVIKRFFMGIHKRPEGWPEYSSIFNGTVNTFKTLRLCPKFWNDEFLLSMEVLKNKKSVYIIRSLEELNQFIENLSIEN